MGPYGCAFAHAATACLAERLSSSRLSSFTSSMVVSYSGRREKRRIGESIAPAFSIATLPTHDKVSIQILHIS